MTRLMESENPDRRRDRRMGLLIVGVAFVAALSISWWARGVSTPGNADRPSPPTADGVVGFPHKVEAVGTLEAARSLTKRVELRGIAALAVKSDGTVDVSAPGSRIRYVFSSPRGEGPQPVRPPGTLPNRAYCGRQNIHVKKDGMVADPDQSTAPCPAERGDGLPAPRCSPKEVWQVAIRRGAPADRLASIDYFRASAGPAWRFEIPGTPHSFTLYGDCVRELYGFEATGSVP
jgi:hypothetical protein